MSLLAEINDEAKIEPAKLDDEKEEESLDSLKEDVYANENSDLETDEDSESESEMESEEIHALTITGRNKLFREDEATFQAPGNRTESNEKNVSEIKKNKYIYYKLSQILSVYSVGTETSNSVIFRKNS